MPRKIDQAYSKSRSWMGKKLILVKKSKLINLRNLIIVAFIAGAIASTIWIVDTNRQTQSKAAGSGPRCQNGGNGEDLCNTTCDSWKSMGKCCVSIGGTNKFGNPNGECIPKEQTKECNGKVVRKNQCCEPCSGNYFCDNGICKPGSTGTNVSCKRGEKVCGSSCIKVNECCGGCVAGQTCKNGVCKMEVPGCIRVDVNGKCLECSKGKSVCYTKDVKGQCVIKGACCPADSVYYDNFVTAEGGTFTGCYIDNRLDRCAQRVQRGLRSECVRCRDKSDTICKGKCIPLGEPCDTLNNDIPNCAFYSGTGRQRRCKSCELGYKPCYEGSECVPRRTQCN